MLTIIIIIFSIFNKLSVSNESFYLFTFYFLLCGPWGYLFHAYSLPYFVGYQINFYLFICKFLLLFLSNVRRRERQSCVLLILVLK